MRLTKFKMKSRSSFSAFSLSIPIFIQATPLIRGCYCISWNYTLFHKEPLKDYIKRDLHVEG